MHCISPPASFHLPRTRCHGSFRPSGFSFLRIAEGSDVRLDAKLSVSLSIGMVSRSEILTGMPGKMTTLFGRLARNPKLLTLISEKLTRNAKWMTIPPERMTAIFRRLTIIPGLQVTFSKKLTNKPKMMTSGFHGMTNNFKMLVRFSGFLTGRPKKLTCFSTTAERREEHTGAFP